MSNKNIKLGFVKSKAYGLCGVILTTALLATFANTTYADETTDTTPSTETITKTEEPTTPATEILATDESQPTEISKEGTEIAVKNPEVDLHFDGNQSTVAGKHDNFQVEYKNIKFPDSMPINEGDTVTFNMPKEITFRTDFDFDVKNPANETIGHAQTSIEHRNITTTFNDYFSKNPLNKEMAMTFDAKWTDAVKPGTVVKPNFDGTVKTVQMKEDKKLDPNKEKFSKWGVQSKNDAQVLQWTLRFNLAQQTLENAILKDRWSANQEFVEGSLKLRTVENPDTWSGDVSAQEYLDSFHVQNGGFDLKLKTLNKFMYIKYQTRLKTPVKESTDPVNAVWLTANDNDKLADNYRARVALVGGKGRASGEADEIPTPVEPNEETPKETPKDEPKEKETPKETPKDEPKAHNSKQEAQPQAKQLPNTGTTTSTMALLGLTLMTTLVALRKKKN